MGHIRTWIRILIRLHVYSMVPDRVENRPDLYHFYAWGWAYTGIFGFAASLKWWPLPPQSIFVCPTKVLAPIVGVQGPGTLFQVGVLKCHHILYSFSFIVSVLRSAKLKAVAFALEPMATCSWRANNISGFFPAGHLLGGNPWEKSRVSILQ